MIQHVQTIAERHKPKKALVVEIYGGVIRSVSGVPYMDGPDDIELIPGIKKKLWSYRLMDYLVFGVGVDPTVAHGAKSEDQFMREQQRVGTLFGGNNPFHSAQMIIHDPTGYVEPYNFRSLFAFPNIGMLSEIELNSFKFGHQIDWDHSLFVGKSAGAEKCANTAGITFRHIDEFMPAYGKEEVE